MDAYNIILHNNINNCWQIQEIFMFLEAITKDVNKLQAGSLRFSIQLLYNKRDSLARGIATDISMHSCLLCYFFLSTGYGFDYSRTSSLLT